MQRVIIPKTYADINSPLIFLAGPIRGAPKWQDEAIKYIIKEDKEVVIASPTRTVEKDIVQYLVSGKNDVEGRQRAWERHYLDVAAKNGVIMFWLPGEVNHSCSKAYGAMTRKELGLVLGWYKFDKSIRFCVGTDGRFSEFRTHLYDINIDAPNIEIKNSLEGSCQEALRLIRLAR